MSESFDVDYFIQKFNRIPEELWLIGTFWDGKGRGCAMGHCHDSTYTRLKSPEEKAISSLFNGWTFVANINDGEDERFLQQTPKERILAALAAIKDGTYA